MSVFFPRKETSVARRSTTRRNTVRRPVEWLRTRTAFTNLPGAAGVATAAAFDITPTQFLTLVSPTVVRIRGELSMSADLATDGMAVYAAGFVQMSRKAFTTGIAAIPFPGLDDVDWQWYHSAVVGDAGSSVLVPENDVVHVMIDSKAMRRYEQDDQTLVFVVANLSGLAATDLNFYGSFSILIKE